MSQFTVFRNPRRDTNIPFVVQIQSTRLSTSTRRVVMALVRRGHGAPQDHPLTPHMIVQGEAVYADSLNLATLHASALREEIVVLPEEDQDRIVQAIDDMISRA